MVVTAITVLVVGAIVWYELKEQTSVDKKELDLHLKRKGYDN